MQKAVAPEVASASLCFRMFWQIPTLFHNFHHQWRDFLQNDPSVNFLSMRQNSYFLFSPPQRFV